MPHLPEMHRLGAQAWSFSAEVSQVSSALRTKTSHMRKVLVVEDHYVIALDLSQALERSGVEVLGPVTTLDAASYLLRRHHDIAGAVLDVTLQGHADYPLAAALRQRGVPFVLCTGHSRDRIAPAFRDTVLCEKPLPTAKVVLALQAEMAWLLQKRLAL